MNECCGLTYCGKPLEALSREELLDALINLINTNDKLHKDREHEREFMAKLRGS
jgi:hypothetical protein